tara:strand:- start:458 stop:1087 length:630 start_codon:yes stop_codon:yes gene_type:complete
MTTYDYKFHTFIEKKIQKINSPTIIEFGVKEGRSTRVFLDICKKNKGKLFSVDVDDYSEIINDPEWTFIKSRDDNFNYLKDKIPESFDVIYLDSLHEADHVEKIFYHYFPKLKVNGFFFIDDISWLPYIKNQSRDSFYCEINNKETFDRILNIFQNNQKNFDLDFNFIASGSCMIFKKKNELNKPIKITTRENTLKNLIKKFLKTIKSK